MLRAGPHESKTFLLLHSRSVHCKEVCAIKSAVREEAALIALDVLHQTLMLLYGIYGTLMQRLHVNLCF